MPARRSLAVLSTDNEREAVLPGGATSHAVGPYRARCSSGTTFLVSGIGPAAAAAATATALALDDYELVASLGICGGFAGAAALGDVVIATHLLAGDLGADSPDGFLGLAELGWADDSVASPVPLVDAGARALRAAGLMVVTGPVVTVSSATGTDERAAALAARHGAVAEAMEGWGVAEAGARHGVPVVEVRAVSNLVGRRELMSWDIPRALASLRTAVAALFSEGGAWS